MMVNCLCRHVRYFHVTPFFVNNGLRFSSVHTLKYSNLLRKTAALNLLPLKGSITPTHLYSFPVNAQASHYTSGGQQRYQKIPSETEHRREQLCQSQKRDNLWTIPNLLCIGRIIASPILGYFIINGQCYNAIGILILASLTDFADGLIARKYASQSSKLGTFLDPLADKILIITLYSSMVYTHTIPAVLMELVIFRDVLLLGAGAYIRYSSMTEPRTMSKFLDGSYSNAKLHPTLLSKVNTAIQLFTAVVSLYAPMASISFMENILPFLWYFAGFSTVLSGMSYLFVKNTYTVFKSKPKS